MTAFLASLGIVFLAELGDKTQLLVMAFATRYHWRTVLAGVAAAITFQQLLASLLGRSLASLVPLSLIKLAAAVAFILFGLWTLRAEEEEEEEKKRSSLSPFWTVALSFLVAEMGDKTQLATVALAADYGAFVPVWLGSTAGMIAADGAGAAAGLMLHKRLPERWLRLAAAAAFIAFGLWGLVDYFRAY